MISISSKKGINGPIACCMPCKVFNELKSPDLYMLIKGPMPRNPITSSYNMEKKCKINIVAYEFWFRENLNYYSNFFCDLKLSIFIRLLLNFSLTVYFVIATASRFPGQVMGYICIVQFDTSTDRPAKFYNNKFESCIFVW